MKKYILILFIFFFSYGYSQELINYYLSPEAISGTTEGTVLMLHTTFYYYNGAGYIDHNYTIDGQIITFKLCYALGSTLFHHFDKRVYEIILPDITGDYTFKMEYYNDYNNGNCLYETPHDTGIIDFTLPYEPTEKVEIEDAAFESYLEYLDFGDDVFGNGWVYKNRITNIRHINVAYTNNFFEMDGVVESLSTIGEFKSLKDLNVNNQLLTELNLEENTKLERVYCSGNMIENLNISNSLKLENLRCRNDELLQLDVSNNINLEKLNFSGNLIEEINLSNNIDLMELSIGQTSMSNLDLTNNINLEKFGISNTPLESLDVSNNINLYSIGVYDALLTNLNLIENNLLKYIDLENNILLEAVEISELNSIVTFYCRESEITELDLSLNPNLENVFLMSNNLNSLNIQNGNNENLELLLTLNNPNLFCVEIDEEGVSQPFQYVIDSQTEFSEDCSTPLPTPLLGVNNNSLQQISLYPNPVIDVLVIETQLPIKTIKVYNLQGKLVKEISSNKKIDVSGLATGMYFIKIESDDNSVTKKFVKL